MFCLRKSTEIKLLYLDVFRNWSIFGICEKDVKTLKEGGWYHVYTAIDIVAFKMETEKRVNEIKESFDSLLKKFEADLNKTLNPVYG